MSIRNYINIVEGTLPAPASNTAPEAHSMDELPSVFDNALHGDAGWRTVGDVTGLYGAGMRAMADQLFGSFTSTPIDQIGVLMTLDGGNTPSQVNTVWKWIERNGEKVDTTQVTAPGYRADCTIYSALGYEFMLVTDPGGRYVYAFQGKGALSSDQKHIGHTQDMDPMNLIGRD